MATASITHSGFTNSTDASFRLWGKWVSDSLQAVGLVKTADTGQVNWATVIAPAAGNTFPGFEIYRFNDALQSTSPVYIRLNYGSAGSGATPRMQIIFGTGSDGAGNLTGINTAAMVFDVAASASVGSNIDHYISGAANRFVIALGQGNVGSNANTCMFAAVEREKDINGNDLAGGVYCMTMSGGTGSSSQRQRYHIPGVGDSGEEVGWGMFMPNQGTGVLGADVAVYPLFFQRGVYLPPALSVLGVFAGSVTVSTTISVPMYGVNHTYFVSPHRQTIPRANTTNGTRFCFLYE